MPIEGGEQHDLLESESLRLTVARLRVRLMPDHPVPRADHLRAAISSFRPELDLMHQHGKDGFIYRYPRVLYRVLGREPMIVAVAEGIDALSTLVLVGEYLRLGATIHHVVDTTLDITDHGLGASRSIHRYRFAAPWLALNQENYTRFGRMSANDRQHLLDAQVANNCLSLAKSFGLRLSTRLESRAFVRPVPVRLKGIEMIGFFGEIYVNFCIPEDLGLGKSASKGFGAIRRVD
jgi:hypothetical protein